MGIWNPLSNHLSHLRKSNHIWKPYVLRHPWRRSTNFPLKNISHGARTYLSFGNLPLLALYQRRLPASRYALYIMRPFDSIQRLMEIVCEEGILLYSGLTTLMLDIQGKKRLTTVNMWISATRYWDQHPRTPRHWSLGCGSS
jgi:hypothetical protein